ncbi:exodeoxyribonuclease III [Bradyrhizobium sp. IC3069]|uniref:exodeoxyribonuclease III n=1 Tax=unclassified Bradyrhizobium TaxID=2631580 RepID=UPI001CD51773|nr:MULTISPECIES: exodeoxyribonuclease III [unclassified Bradyrhizobium]MCA1363690.1 exodeoxyribonuclease III [Bradyrhizobium sp. IC4059]MCA1521245.1 exodeoxyribonuclease III [Bradyrhizobium sp. IC3069]
MKIATWNINGLRSSVRAGFQEWLGATKSDVVCLQEVKTEEDLLGNLWFPGYNAYWFGADRSGYSGVLTLVSTRINPISIQKGIGDPDIDREGRVLLVELGDLEIVNVYAPHSHRALTRLDFKLHFLRRLEEFIAERRRRGKPLIVVGDLNVALEERDVANYASNRKNAGFLPEERSWLDAFLKSGFSDAFRVFCEEPGHYTWWSPIKGVRERNIGWRLDYILVDKRLTQSLKSCFHMPEQKGSDHCPVIAELLPIALQIEPSGS